MIDIKQAFYKSLERAKTLIESAFPIKGRKFTIEASNFTWKNVGDAVISDLTAQKKFKLEERSLAASLVANVQIVENATGKAVASKNNHIIFQFPHITMRGSFLWNGTERQIINQLRLRPGIYAGFDTQNNVKVHFNTTAAGSYKLELDRETQVINFRVSTQGFPIISVLTAMGMADAEIRQLLGDKIYQANKPRSDIDGDARNLLKKFRPYLAIPADINEVYKLIQEFLQSKPLDPTVNKVTVSEAIGSIDLAAIRSATKKAIDLANGNAKEDDKESLAFKNIFALDDFIAEKLAKTIPDIKKSVGALVDRKQDVVFALPPSTFTNITDTFFTKSEFTRYSDQNNPIDITSVNGVVTSMGEGGIKSYHAVTDNVRAVHPSHFGLLDPVHTPEGQKIGITAHLTINSKKVGNNLALDLFNPKTGKLETKIIQDVVNSTVAFPDQYENLGAGIPKPRSNMIKARKADELVTVPPNQIDYIFKSPESFFSSTTAAVPFLNNNDANRVLMGDKHIEQAVNLKDPDRPLVMHVMEVPGKKDLGKGYEEVFSSGFHQYAQAPVDGRVTKVTKDVITVKPTKGAAVDISIHNNYPLNSNTFFTDTPLVNVGDKVTAGQQVANNNFFKDGALAIGKNLRVAYTAYKGYNFEDGVVISEGAAKKLTSVHKHELRVDVDKNVKVGAAVYTAQFPEELKYMVDSKNRYDSDGIIKKGQILNPGDIAIPAFQLIPLHAEFDYSRLGRKFQNRAVDLAQRWDGLEPAEVIDVVKTKQFVKVILRTEESMKIGDKISVRHGAKGIVVHIVPDKEMYKDEVGNTIDVLLNPMGVPGRVNTGQLYEAAAGKLADKTGKAYYVKNFDPNVPSVLEKLKSDLKAAGVKDAEDITDPRTGEKIENTLVGLTHIYKLKHQVDTKFKARSTVDEAYTVDEQPAKTTDSSAQKIGVLDTFSLLSGNAVGFLSDAFGIKSQKNDDYWIALQKGQITPPPKVPFITEKFVSMLLGAGINLRQSGSKITAAPLTDKEILELSKGEIDKPLVVKSLDLMPEKGGLFDPVKTGGITGKWFNHIQLAAPVANPLMFSAIVSVAKLPTAKSLHEVIAGNLAVTETGQLTKELDKGKTCGEGVQNLLKNIDVKVEIKKTEAETKVAKGDRLDKAYKRLRYLKALDNLKLSPSEAYINNYVPIIPARFRRVDPRMDGTLSVAPANHSYREIIMINNQLKDLKQAGVSQANLKNLNRDLYASVSGLTGLTSPLTRTEEVAGFLERVAGPAAPKTGFFQARVMSRAQDLSARSTVIPNPKLNLDQIGLPKEMAMTIYKPFVVKRLVTSGYDPIRAREMTEKRDELAMKMLELEVQERPAIMTRAPSLHKFNLQAFIPKLIDGRAVEVNPLIVAGYNMDFDGDTAGIHVPVSEEARREAIDKMLPSKNLLEVRRDSLMHAPSRETTHGIYLMTTPKGTPVPFSNREAAMAAYAAKKIKVNQAVKIGNAIECVGQYLFDALLPQQIKIGAVPVNAKKLDEVLLRVSKELKSDNAADIISKVKDLGNHYVTEVGFSISLEDLEIDRKKRDQLLAQAKKDIVVKGFAPVANNLVKDVAGLVASHTDNRFVDLAFVSGALGKRGDVARLVATPVAVEDHKGRVVPILIEKSYAEGHDLGSYMAATPGARKGMIDKGLTVADTGYFNRRVVNSAIEYKVIMPDCGTSLGVKMPLTSSEIYDRFGVSAELKDKLITPELSRQLLAKGKTDIVVRSPLTCQAVGGVCAKCFGLTENGQLAPIGLHIGALAGQTVGERATQITLKSFHSGGAIGGAKIGFDRISELVEMPQNVKNKATLASVTGKITKIEASPTGGWYVTVDKTKHFVPQELGLGVSSGQTVQSGDMLSKGGSIKPQELLEYTGSVNRVRDYLVDELAKNYSKEQGAYVKRKLIETIVRPLTDKATVTDPGDAGSSFGIYPGDLLQINNIKDMNRKLREAGKKEIQFNPTLYGINSAPFTSGDFVGMLIHERLKDQLSKAPALALSTDLEVGHPMARLALKNLKSIEDIKKGR